MFGATSECSLWFDLCQNFYCYISNWIRVWIFYMHMFRRKLIWNIRSCANTITLRPVCYHILVDEEPNTHQFSGSSISPHLDMLSDVSVWSVETTSGNPFRKSVLLTASFSIWHRLVNLQKQAWAVYTLIIQSIIYKIYSLAAKLSQKIKGTLTMPHSPSRHTSDTRVRYVQFHQWHG